MCRCADVTDHQRIGAQYEQVPNVTTVLVFSYSIIIIIIINNSLTLRLFLTVAFPTYMLTE